MIKVVSFDLDGTLVKSTFADKVWLEGLPKLYSKEKNISIKQAKQYIYKLYEKVGESRKEWYDIDWWFKRFDLKQSWKNLLDNYKHYIKLYNDTIETLDKLTKKFKLIIISNAKKEFIEIQLGETNIKPYFDHVFSSLSDFNLVKKTPEVYIKVLNFLKLKSNEIIHIGDNLEFDYKCPQRIGIKSIYLDRNKTKKADNIIFSLYELEKVISNL
ncbi:MAG: HAD family hydrolase [Thermoplasmatales archaeon]|nr:MAG: HAD family hydrolase [Thermoplasmatales archaeon]